MNPSAPGPSRILPLLLLAAALMVSTRPSSAAKRPAGDGGSDWPEITPAEKTLTKIDADPEAGAVILRQSRDGRIQQKADDFVNVLRYHWRLKVLNDRGKEFGEVHIRAGKYSRVEAIEARTIKADGTIVPVPPDQIFEKVAFQVGSIRQTEHVFNFPAVEPGAILEYRYVRHDNGLLFIDPYVFGGDAYTLKSHVSQGFLAGSSYAILCSLCPPAPPEWGEWRDGNQKGQTFTRELTDVPASRGEALMPPARETTPRLDMALNVWQGHYSSALGRQDRFFVDWESVARYVGDSYDHAIKQGASDVAPLVQAWTQGAADTPAKIKAIVRHVQDDFRYIPFVDVVGGTRPLAAVVKDKTADNEEKAVLLLAALKSAGVEGDPVLVAGKDLGTLNPKFFGLTQFSHVIVALPGASGREFIDPTVSYVPYGFVPWRDSGTGALVIHGLKDELVDLPARAEVSTSRYRMTVKPARDGKAQIDLQAEFTGEDALELRGELVPDSESEREAAVKEWLGARRAGAVIASFAFEALDDPSKPLALKMSFQAPGLVTVADDVVLVRGCILTCSETNPLSRSVRQHPFYVDRGWNVTESVAIEPPAGLAAGQMPAAVQARSSLATMSLACSAYGEGGARCERQFTARRNRLPAGEQAGARAMYDKIVQADRTTIGFAPAAAAQGGR
ncbi:MAG TPA: DUF3857 domain-containing protein [Candidatus Polarisedimenticolia bacterium]|nr:DUF3857 domain-containing protein [Candidatus Polarisedimenticolia bacterium]